MSTKKCIIQLMITIGGCFLFWYAIPLEGGLHNLAVFWAHFISWMSLILVFMAMACRNIVETELKNSSTKEQIEEHVRTLWVLNFDIRSPKWFRFLNTPLSFLEAFILIYYGWFILGTLTLLTVSVFIISRKIREAKNEN